MIEQFIEEFGDAAREAAVLELQTRLLADKIGVLRHLSLDALADVEDALIEHYRDSISVDDARVLRDCRIVRSKLLQLELWRSQVEAYAPSAAPAPARSFGDTAAANDVQADARRGGGRLHAWFMTFGRSGSFVNAGHLFRSGLAIIERLLHAPPA